MRALWNSYEPFDISSVKVDSRVTAATPEAIQACWNRCYELEEQYASEGWFLHLCNMQNQFFQRLDT